MNFKFAFFYIDRSVNTASFELREITSNEIHNSNYLLLQDSSLFTQDIPDTSSGFEGYLEGQGDYLYVTLNIDTGFGTWTQIYRILYPNMTVNVYFIFFFRAIRQLLGTHNSFLISWNPQQQSLTSSWLENFHSIYTWYIIRVWGIFGRTGRLSVRHHQYRYWPLGLEHGHKSTAYFILIWR